MRRFLQEDIDAAVNFLSLSGNRFSLLNCRGICLHLTNRARWNHRGEVEIHFTSDVSVVFAVVLYLELLDIFIPETSNALMFCYRCETLADHHAFVSLEITPYLREDCFIDLNLALIMLHYAFTYGMFRRVYSSLSWCKLTSFTKISV